MVFTIVSLISFMVGIGGVLKSKLVPSSELLISSVIKIPLDGSLSLSKDCKNRAKLVTLVSFVSDLSKSNKSVINIFPSIFTLVILPITTVPILNINSPQFSSYTKVPLESVTPDELESRQL